MLTGREPETTVGWRAAERTGAGAPAFEASDMMTGEPQNGPGPRPRRARRAINEHDERERVSGACGARRGAGRDVADDDPDAGRADAAPGRRPGLRASRHGAFAVLDGDRG